MVYDRVIEAEEILTIIMVIYEIKLKNIGVIDCTELAQQLCLEIEMRDEILHMSKNVESFSQAH